MSFKFERCNGDAVPDVATLRNILQSEGYDVMEWTDAPGTVYPPHSHLDDQSHWVISGELELTVGPETYTLLAGNRDLLPAGTTHSAFVPGKAPVRYLIGVKRR